MSLILDQNIKTFDSSAIKRGDCVRFRHTEDPHFKNGFVTKVADREIEILYCNTQNNGTSYIKLHAVDVAFGVYEIFWTRDFNVIYSEYSLDSGGNYLDF